MAKARKRKSYSACFKAASWNCVSQKEKIPKPGFCAVIFPKKHLFWAQAQNLSYVPSILIGIIQFVLYKVNILCFSLRFLDFICQSVKLEVQL